LFQQTSSKPAVETTSLTTSFGWNYHDAWDQHDIQELCRVMFDALEQTFKNTEQADLISRLYEGIFQFNMNVIILNSVAFKLQFLYEIIFLRENK
jgi:hypothetical protein